MIRPGALLAWIALFIVGWLIVAILIQLAVVIGHGVLR